MKYKLFIVVALASLVSYPAFAQDEEVSDDSLDQELEFLNKQEAPLEPVQAAEPEEDDSPSLTDTLSEGLKSLFGSDEEATEEGQALPDEAPLPGGDFTNHAVLQGLNKITARTSSLEMGLNEPITFGTLEITVHQCWKAAPEEPLENKALMEIWEQKPGEEKTRIFNGWMFSSSPSISALENPVYDITVVKCEAKGEEKAPEKSAS